MKQFEDVVIAQPKLEEIGSKIKKNLHNILPEHVRHRARIFYDGYSLVWVKCLECDVLWDHCDFCKQSRYPEQKGAKRLLDFGCRSCRK